MLVACEKVIIDDNGNASLIILLQNITVSVNSNPVPENAVTPKEWAVFSMWQMQAEDAGTPFQQIVEIRYPNGDLFKRAELDFTTSKDFQYIRINIVGFPIGQKGRYSIHGWLEKKNKRVTDEYIYPFSVGHKREE